MCLIGAMTLLSAANAQAATTTGTFTASATIAQACTVSAANLAFGAYTPTAGAALTGNSTINVYCTSGWTYTIALNVGTGGGSFTGRKMANGASLMTFNLYTTSALTTVWGDGTGATATVAGTGTGELTANPATVYGSIPIAQDLPVGTYSSVITVTVTY
jgi:spore coat protein U-like protein